MTGRPEGIASGPTDRPPNFVAGVIDDRAAFERAVEALVEAGIARESLGILQGERGADAIAGRHGGGLRSWLQRAGELFSDEPDYVRRYEEEARRGHFVVGVPLPDSSQATRERIRAILTAGGAHAIASSTPWTHTGGE
jgi:Rad3-related DNA helicase